MTDNDSSQEKKVTLDKSELDVDRAREKVELDLDDAPFLDEEEDEELSVEKRLQYNKKMFVLLRTKRKYQARISGSTKKFWPVLQLF